MKITRIDTFPVRIPLKPERQMISALGRHEVSEYVVVRISTDAGIEGAGEATVLPRWSGETVWGAHALIERLFAPHLVGRDPTDVADIAALMDQAAEDNWFAKSAVEMACWDIRGKELGKPLYELLGGPVRPRAIRCRFSMGAYDPERARRRAAELIAAGFDTIKVKVGTQVSSDIERVRIVRGTVGPRPAIVIDANCGYDAKTAIAMAGEIEDCRVDLFEQPTPRGDFEALAEVRQSIQPQVMADDICFDLADAVELIRHQACDVISVYPGKNGGIAKSKRIIDVAARHGMACSIGSNLELDIASSAMCHLVVACPNINIERYPGDIMGPDYHSVCVVKEPLEIRGPIITAPDRPGLGVEVDWKVVEAHRCPW
jgi:L-Ala-D/L-Glu epimerase